MYLAKSSNLPKTLQKAVFDQKEEELAGKSLLSLSL